MPLFFALSGLLLYRPWARAALDGTAGPRVLGYLWRRGLRVLPAYWIVAGTALLLWSREHLDSARAWVEVLTLTFIYNLDPWWNGTGPHGLGQMWSLCVEVSFYLLLPLLALVLAWLAARGGDDVNRRARWLLAGILALGVVAVLALIPQFYPEPRPYLHSWLPRSLGMFAVGMALAVVTEWAWREPGADGPVRRLCRTLSHSATLCGALALIVYLLAATPAAGPRFFGVEGLWVALFSMVMSTLFAFFIVAPIAFAAPAAHGPGGAALDQRSVAGHGTPAPGEPLSRPHLVRDLPVAVRGALPVARVHRTGGLHRDVPVRPGPRGHRDPPAGRGHPPLGRDTVPPLVRHGRRTAGPRLAGKGRVSHPRRPSPRCLPRPPRRRENRP